jgi:diguanylate cyclase (GGDEF)-like protein/PAS domain S-box-containing protein
MNFLISKVICRVKASVALQIMAMTAAYIATAQFAVTFAVMQNGIVVFWMPNAIVLVTLLLSQRHHWWIFCATAIGAELIVDSIGGAFHVWQALDFGCINVAEAILSAILLRQYCGEKVTFSKLREVLIFAAITMGVAPVLAALAGAWIYAISPGNETPFWVNWRIWWIGDGMGMISLAPLLLGWLQKPAVIFPKSPSRPLHGFMLTLLSIVLCTVLFYPDADAKSLLTFSPLLLLPLILWAAMQFGVRGATLLGCLISVSATLGSAQGRGLFSSLPQDVRTVVLQQFLASLLLTGLAIAAVLNDLRVKYLGQRLFREAVEHMQEGMTITDANSPDHPIVYANPKFEELTGYTADEFLGQNSRFLNALHRDQPEITAIREAIAHQASFQCTVQNSKKDGTPFWNLLTISPIRDERGKVTHFIGIQRDVTKAIETENLLLQVNAQLVATNQALEERVTQRTADLERLATTDPLTGVFNRRYWMKRAEIEIALAKRQQTSLSMVMLDIDNFKQINDRYGHPTGDVVLVYLCEAVQKELRLGDTFARIGGEEFVLLLPQTDEVLAVQVAERIRTLVSSIELAAMDKTKFGFTASFGVTTLSDFFNDVESLLSSCDAALYRAKNAGRNCVSATTVKASFPDKCNSS